MAEESKSRGEDIDREVARNLDNLPDRINSLKKYVANLVDIIHYYFDRFGPYLPSKERKEWTKLVLLSDIIYLEMESIRNTIEVMENTIRKRIIAGKKEKVPRNFVKEMNGRLGKLEADVEDLRKKTERLLRNLMEYVERVGIE